MLVLLALASVSRADAPCSARSAVPATIEQIVSHPAQYRDRCLAVDGYLQAHELFQNVDGVYRVSPQIFDQSSNGLRIGIVNRYRRRAHEIPYRPVTVIGTAQDCESAREYAAASAAQNEVVIIGGYCHTDNGAYLSVVATQSRPAAPLERRLPHNAGPGYGDLEPVPAAWPRRGDVERLSEDFLEALRARDAKRLAALHVLDADPQRHREASRLLEFLLKDRRSPFAEIRQRDRAPSMVILVERPYEALASDAEASNDDGATVCFCRQASCSDVWPIAQIDADNDPSRPYACTVLTSLFNGSTTRPQFTTVFGGGGLREPTVR